MTNVSYIFLSNQDYCNINVGPTLIAVAVFMSHDMSCLM